MPLLMDIDAETHRVIEQLIENGPQTHYQVIHAALMQAYFTALLDDRSREALDALCAEMVMPKGKKRKK